MEKIIFDIETGKNDRYMEFLPKKVKTPKRLKKDTDDTYMLRVAESIEEWESECALSATTGKILCIGYKVGDHPATVFGDGMDEKSILTQFWDTYHTRKSGVYMIGWNSHKFDLPYIYQRSVILGVKTGVVPVDRNWRMSIDLKEIWLRWVYGKQADLGSTSLALGFKGKMEDGDISERFEWYWENDRKKAIENCTQDVEMTSFISERLL